MKIIADTHSHTLASGHAYSTLTEMAQSASEKGLEILAITDHAPTMPGTCGLFYFQNFDVVPRQLCGVRLLMGAEVNIMAPDGSIDLPEKTCKDLDLVVASLHTPCYGTGHSVEENTQAYLSAMKNPYIHIIGHPDDARFPYDQEAVVKMAKETGTLLELNNSSLRPKSSRVGTREMMGNLLRLCKQYAVPVTTGSDAHIQMDAGNFTNIKKILEEWDFPEELVVTTDAKKLLSYLK